jgi:hypothetical protein
MLILVMYLFKSYSLYYCLHIHILFFYCYEGPFIFAPSMRRIGKSVTVNMLAAMASGQRDMFNGYAVNNPGSSFKMAKLFTP